MQELIAKANRAMLESQYLRRKGRSLRFEACVLANELSKTIHRTRCAERESVNLKASLDQALLEP